MNITAEAIWSAVRAIPEKAPVIHNITNYVVMNNTANALLALGASPVMAHAEEEVEEMVGIAGEIAFARSRDRGVSNSTSSTRSTASPRRTSTVS